jgi:hypothetical protein
MVMPVLPQAISLVLHGNMMFEDALGRVQSLQYQQFKHWTVFETSLPCVFANAPGMKKVLDGHFVLTASAPARTLTASNWTQLDRGLRFICLSSLRLCPLPKDNVHAVMLRLKTSFRTEKSVVRIVVLHLSSESDLRRRFFAKPPPRLELANDSLNPPGVLSIVPTRILKRGPSRYRQ